MREKRIALDFDSTLASITDVAFDLLCGPDHDYGYDDIEDWTWGFREFGKEAYLSALWHGWTIRPEEVQPLEHDLDESVAALRDVGEVDIVTAHPNHLGITKGKKEWLARNGIEYDNFVVVEPDSTKAKMDYNVYIDDKPALPEMVAEHNPQAQVYVRDWPYNEGVDGHYHRVASVSEAVRRIQQRELVEA
jgi:5'(3')-deoxyribonucleotidase